MSQWNWCAENCKSSNGVGAAVRLTIEMINQVVLEADSDDPDSGDSSTNSSRSLPDCTGGSCENGAVEDLGGVFLSVLNTYMIQQQDGTITQLTLPKNPTLAIDPPPSTQGATQRTTTLVLEIPRANFTSDSVLIYDPLLSYSSINDDSSLDVDDADASTSTDDITTSQDGTGDDSDDPTSSTAGGNGTSATTSDVSDDSDETTTSHDGTTVSGSNAGGESPQSVSSGNKAYQVYHSFCILMLGAYSTRSLVRI
ncbi:unnamed protein product [Symbiodinium sp. CCMP2456]|nr:unnamed protein product [Symbiodinium sp. CCMP2456]